MEVNLPWNDSPPSIEFRLWQHVREANGDIIQCIQATVPESVHRVPESSRARVDAVAVSWQAVLLGILVAQALGFHGEVATLGEDEELEGVLDGVQVVELAPELRLV